LRRLWLDDAQAGRRDGLFELRRRRGERGRRGFVETAAQDTSDVIETSEDANFEGKPTAEETCPECGHDTAWYTIKQTGSADEPPTRFFKCKECGARWRDYS